jgi:hypothetical protein
VCLAYGFFKSPDLVEVILGGNFAINFNRDPGSSDVKVPVDLSRDKPEVHLRFVGCVQKLLPVIEEKINHLR